MSYGKVYRGQHGTGYKAGRTPIAYQGKVKHDYSTYDVEFDRMIGQHTRGSEQLIASDMMYTGHSSEYYDYN